MKFCYVAELGSLSSSEVQRFGTASTPFLPGSSTHAVTFLEVLCFKMLPQCIFELAFQMEKNVMAWILPPGSNHAFNICYQKHVFMTSCVHIKFLCTYLNTHELCSPLHSINCILLFYVGTGWVIRAVIGVLLLSFAPWLKQI